LPIGLLAPRIVCDENGLAVFELIRGHSSKRSAVLCAFDLLELDGRNLTATPDSEYCSRCSSQYFPGSDAFTIGAPVIVVLVALAVHLMLVSDKAEN
jgi:hypothetical protein